MKLLSWNVNGIRAVLKKNLLDVMKEVDCEIYCFQETKARESDVSKFWPDSYHAFWNAASKKGYSGTLILTKPEPLRVRLGIGDPSHDDEGRVLTAEYANYFVVNVYVPNSQRELTRLGYRQSWDLAFLNYLNHLQSQKPVIVCGDFNVAHKEIDLTYPKANLRNHGFTVEERSGFDSFIQSGLVDTFRVFEDRGGFYTWWSVMSNARARNVGWRIDYFLVSSVLRPKLQSAFIRSDILGSDHCPIGITIDLG